MSKEALKVIPINEWSQYDTELETIIPVGRLELPGMILDADAQSLLVGRTDRLSGAEKRFLPGMIFECRGRYNDRVYRFGSAGLIIFGQSIINIFVIDEKDEGDIERTMGVSVEYGHSNKKGWVLRITERDGLWYAIAKHFTNIVGDNLFDIQPA